MSPNPKVAMAFSAMRALGISEKKVKPVLKNLLKLYDKNWQLIEEENYRVLADAIFEYEENEVDEKKKEVQSGDDCRPPLKRLRLKHQEEQASPSGETSTKRPKVEANEPENCMATPLGDEKLSEPEGASPKVHLQSGNEELLLLQGSPIDESEEPSQLHLRKKRSEPEPISAHTKLRDKGKEPIVEPVVCHRQDRERPGPLCIRENIAESLSISPTVHPVSKRVDHGQASSAACFNLPKTNPGVDPLAKELLSSDQNNGLINPKTEPCIDEDPQIEIPIAIMHPPNPEPKSNKDPVYENGNNCNGKRDGVEFFVSQHADVEDEGQSDLGAAHEGIPSLELADIPEASPANVEIASSSSGKVKISLSCNYAPGQPNFRPPSPEVVLKMVEDKCLKSYKTIEPNFSLMKIMKELCECFLNMSNDSVADKEEDLTHITPNSDLLNNSNLKNTLVVNDDHQDTFHMPGSSVNGSLKFHSSAQVVPQVREVLALADDFHSRDDLHEQVLGDTNCEAGKTTDQHDSDSSSLSSFIAVLHKKKTDIDTRPLHDVNDISKGEESVRISLVNEVSSEPYPPLFFYIPRSIIFRNANVKFSLFRIGDEDCCSNCFGDCMASSLPCACARETGGDFAYTLEGVLKENFLDECISMNRDPQQSCLSYCKICPFERCKNADIPEPCKGHIPRKFIKECWSKCGCNKQCGNRVVQRGITHNLQVFFTADGKGWGLRTLEDLPRGTFVCEYIGEILTNMEMHERNMQIPDVEKHISPVMLDAAWSTELVVKDRDALCLDATFYGNVARFINHRCFDANLVQIPVEVETPYHHYYHLAFFTTRNIDALEELTWDYGVDFDDHNNGVKSFQCRCGSKCCRDMKQSHKTKLNALLLQ